MSDVIDPRDSEYGASGDGTTDDTDAFRNAAAAAASQGKPLDVSGATYLLNPLNDDAAYGVSGILIPINGANFTMIGDRGDNIRIAAYTPPTGTSATASSGQTDFPIGFAIPGAGYLIVSVDGVQTSEFTVIDSNTVIKLNAAAAGGETVTIQRNGNYHGIFGSTQFITIQKWRFIDVGFDKNSQNNVIPNADVVRMTPGRYAVTTLGRGHVAGEVSFERCLIRNADAVVDFYIPERVKNDASGAAVDPEDRPRNRLIRILSCDWHDARLGGTADANGNGPDHDQSFINVASDMAVITGNTLEGESWAMAPTTFIETHCERVVVANNTAHRIQVFANLTQMRHSAGTDFGLLCTGNYGEVSRRCIQTPWADSQTTTPAVNRLAGSGIHVTDNVFHHRWTEYRWAQPRLTGIVAFIGGDGTTTLALDVDDVVIARNQILYDEPAGTDAMARTGQPSYDAAIGWYAGAKQDWRIRRCDISDNVVVNCPGRAVQCEYGVVEALTVSGNKAVNCARSTLTTSLDPTVFFFSTAFRDSAVIAGNRAWVDASLSAAEHPAYFIYLRDQGSGDPRIVLRDNDLFGSVSCAYLGDHSSLAGKLLIQGGMCPSVANSMGATQNALPGSWVLLADNSQAHRRIKPTTGPGWALEAWLPAPPASGTWPRFSVIHNNSTASLRVVEEWVCLSAGTPGTWRASKTVTTVGTVRPTLTEADRGAMFLDGTATPPKPIWWIGWKWIDATGADA